MAGARLRRSVRYPGSGSDSDAALDEQEQDGVIARLAAENAARNDRFRRALLALPLLAALPCLPLLARPRDAAAAVLALSSLLCTAVLLRRLPPPVTGIGRLDAWARRAAARGPRRRPVPVRVLDARSPLDVHLPYLNLALAAVLALMGAATGRGLGLLGWLNAASLPLLVYGAVLAAKVVMAGVDPERELSALKYAYKGA